LVEIEEDLFKTNHYIVGYVVTKSWQLPDIVCQVIQHHHNTDIGIHSNLTLKNMLAINMLAEGVLTKLLESENNDEGIYGLDVDSKKIMTNLLDELNFDDDDFKDILETAKEITENE
jgi:HD-like signal output (HDOD) protein